MFGDEGGVDATTAVFDDSQSEIVGVAERGLGAKTESTDLVVRISLGRFKVGGVNVDDLLV